MLRRFILFSNRFKNNNIKQKIFRYIFKQITSIQEDYIHIFKQIYIYIDYIYIYSLEWSLRQTRNIHMVLVLVALIKNMHWMHLLKARTWTRRPLGLTRGAWLETREHGMWIQRVLAIIICCTLNKYDQSNQTCFLQMRVRYIRTICALTERFCAASSFCEHNLFSAHWEETIFTNFCARYMCTRDNRFCTCNQF